MLTIWKRYAFSNTADYVKRYQKYSYKLGNIKQFQTYLFLFPNYKLFIKINNLNKTKNTLNKIKTPASQLDHNSSNRIFFTTTNVFRRQYISLQIKTICFPYTFINFGISFIAAHFLNSYIWLLLFLNNFFKHSHRRLWGFSSSSNFSN